MARRYTHRQGALLLISVVLCLSMQLAYGANICLNMITRDDAAHVEKALKSVAPHISAAVVCDTGSTDGTGDKVTKFLSSKEIPGKLYTHEWKDFGSNKNLCLEALKEWSAANGDVCEYIWFLDADQVGVGPSFINK